LQVVVVIAGHVIGALSVGEGAHDLQGRGVLLVSRRELRRERRIEWRPEVMHAIVAVAVNVNVNDQNLNSWPGSRRGGHVRGAP